jgi:hypothetical protein
MATHTDHLTETEDAAFDSTMKWTAAIVALFAIMGAASWYFSS